MSACLDENTILELAHGLLSRDSLGEAVRHLDACAECRRLIADATPGPRDPDVDVLRPGASVGRYLVRGAVGGGAMGVVYAAHDPQLGRNVALKLLRPDATEDATALRARLMREAQTLARLCHPNIVTVFDVGSLGDRTFIALEHVEGGTLADWVGEKERACHEIIAMFAQAGRGLHAAHAHGVVHRDFKPDNVLVGRDGRVRVTDFGLAREVDAHEPVSDTRADDAALRLTATGALIGTPAYMAPEQLDGKPADARSDQFAFCVALYDALYRERPFAATDVESLRREVRAGRARPPPRGSRVPSRVRRALLRGLSPEPSERHRDMAELLAALERDPARARRRWAAATGSVLLASAALAIAIPRARAPDETPPPELQHGVVLLPFANEGDPEQGYFVDELANEVGTRLALVSDLHVTADVAVLSARGAGLREIGQVAGAASAVQGSVRRVGDRVLVDVRLVETRNGRKLWAASYDRDFHDVFDVEASIVDAVARKLGAVVSASERARIARRDTESAPAHDLAMRAVHLWRRDGWREDQPQKTVAIEELYRRALGLDPSYALMHAFLADLLLHRYWYVSGTPESVADEAKMHAEAAKQCAPELSFGDLTLGEYYYWVRRDYPKALEAFEDARSSNSREAHLWSSFVLRRQGRFDEAARRQQQFVSSDMIGQLLLPELGETLAYERRYEEADRALDRAVAAGGDLTRTSLWKAFVMQAWRGESGPAEKVLADVRGKIDAQGRLGGWELLEPLLQSNPRAALPVLDAVDSDWIVTSEAAIPKAFFYAVAHEALGDATLAGGEYAVAVPLLESRVDHQLRNARQQSLLALAYAGIGRRADALRAASAAVDAMPIARDAMLGSAIAIDRALVEAKVGATDEAIGHLEELLATPCLLSPALLRIDPRWSALRGDPRFRRLAGLT